jgi:hypothetical protein
MSTRLIETVIDEERGISYQFEATFRFMDEFESKGNLLSKTHQQLHDNECPVEVIKQVIACSLSKIDGDSVDYAKKEQEAEVIIERFGITEVSVLSLLMVSRAALGDIKKSESDKEVSLMEIMEQMQGKKDRKQMLKEMEKEVLKEILSHFRWNLFAKAGLLLAAISGIFGIVAWSTFSYFMKLI